MSIATNFTNEPDDEGATKTNPENINDSSCLDLLSTRKSTTSVDCDDSIKINSNFLFVGDYSNPYEVIRRSPDFDSIILMLHEIQSDDLHKYEGPHRVTKANLEHAKKRAIEINEKRQEMTQMYENQVLKYLHAERVDMLKEIGPPWSWLHQFASHNSRNKSYNFVEYESIASDLTPPESSDESFDFEREKFITPECLTPSNRSSSAVNLSDLSLIDAERLLKETMSNEQQQQQECPISVKSSNETFLNEVMLKLGQAKEMGVISLTDNPSIVSFFENENDKMDTTTNDDNTGHQQQHQFNDNTLDYRLLKQFLVVAEKDNRKFNDLNELFEYITLEYEKQINAVVQRPVTPTEVIFRKTDDPNKADDNSSNNLIQIEATDVPVEIKSSKNKKVILPIEVNKEVNAPTIDGIASTTKTPAKIEKPHLEDIFMDAGIEVDNKVLKKEVSDNMILGLAEKPETESIETLIKSEAIKASPLEPIIDIKPPTPVSPSPPPTERQPPPASDAVSINSGTTTEVSVHSKRSLKKVRISFHFVE